MATRRVAGLLEAGAKVRVVSPEISAELQARADVGEMETIAAPYAAEFLEGAFLVFVATNDSAVNAQARRDAQARNLLVNAAEAPEAGDFIVPATVRRGDLLLSVTTGGATPTLAAEIRRELEARFGPEYAEYVELLGRLRDYIKEKNTSEPKRRAAHSRLLAIETELLTLLREGQSAKAAARAREEIEKTEDRKQKSE